MTQDRRPSSIDVARLANVSQSAVSRTFTPGASVSPATRERVLAAADALGYRPNLLPRMLHTDRTNMVALVAGGLGNPFYVAALDSLAARLREAGKLAVLVRVSSDQALDEVVADLAGYRVDAVVSALSVRSEATARALEAIRTPLVQLAHGVTGERIWTVNVDNLAAGQEAAALLIARGGRRFAYIGGPDSPTQDRRQAGFLDSLAAQGIRAQAMASVSYDHRGGHEAMRAWLHRGDPAPDALFCVNDLVACGAIDALRSAGFAIPNDVRVIGFDNIEQAAWPAYGLTSFDQRIDILVSRVVAILHSLDGTVREHLINATLIERASTA